MNTDIVDPSGVFAVMIWRYLETDPVRLLDDWTKAACWGCMYWLKRFRFRASFSATESRKINWFCMEPQNPGWVLYLNGGGCFPAIPALTSASSCQLLLSSSFQSARIQWLDSRQSLCRGDRSTQMPRFWVERGFAFNRALSLSLPYTVYTFTLFDN